MESAVNPMRRLYRKLSAFGLPKSFVREAILPSWWDDQAAESEAGFSEALMLVARHTGLDLASLRSDAPSACPAGGAPVKYKKARGGSEEDLFLARILTTQVARIALFHPRFGLSPGTARAPVPPVPGPSAPPTRH